ncbi:hypothetical protein [Candidatus Uabimicrobium sp. HlEnr_7]|uniref:hypothetical protein n=1 Tax=Candidatus Uabimicrobium helgolandensis TaxID=3095367 RepID=UPI0035562209
MQYHYSLRIILLAFLCILTACKTTTDLDIWPLVYYEKNKSEQTTQLDMLASVYSQTDSLEKTTYSFRPFFVGEFSKDGKKSEILALWPLVRYTKEPNDTLVSVLPFYYSRDLKKTSTGERDYDWFFLPFAAFGGSDTKEGSYLYMGFWGNIKGLLGYDEITGKPFPFYVTAKDGEYFSQAYMWPFFRFGNGDGKTFRFYAFLYSYYKNKNKYERRSFVWPFVHYNKEDLNTKYPRTDFMVFPLYGQSTSEQSLAWMFMWPFFSYSAHDNGYREYNLPWPFFKYRSAKGIDEFRIWPFYWKNNQKDGTQSHEDLVLMWPFYWSFQSDYPTHTKKSLYILPFYSQHWSKGKDANAKEEMRLKIWPIFDYNVKEDGSFRSRILSPLWFEDYVPYGFEKSWLPLFTFFDYNQGNNGEKAVTFLGPLYTAKKKDNLEYQRFLFFSYKNEKIPKGDQGRFSVLGGLFEYNWLSSERGLRFFYLPTWPTWSK